MKTTTKAFIILIVLALLFVGANSLVITNENEYSLIRQFGKVDYVIDHAGISFKIPFIQSVDTLPKETLLYDLSSSDVITSDKKTMICNSYILWHITDPRLFAQTLNSSIGSNLRPQRYTLRCHHSQHRQHTEAIWHRTSFLRDQAVGSAQRQQGRRV